MILGKRLDERIKALKYEYNYVADRAGISHTSIWQYVNNNSNPSVEVLLSLSEILDCTIDYLLGRTDEPHYLVISGEQVPRNLRDKGVDAVEVLRDQVRKDGGLTEEAQREVLQIVSTARLLKGKRRRTTPDESPSDTSE